jgi:hypothetical protein
VTTSNPEARVGAPPAAVRCGALDSVGAVAAPAPSNDDLMAIAKAVYHPEAARKSNGPERARSEHDAGQRVKGAVVPTPAARLVGSPG